MLSEVSAVSYRNSVTCNDTKVKFHVLFIFILYFPMQRKD